ncbi:hypothetical protein BB560_003219 [Smittium megazygosporum]|uniref:Eukaryotic translation initiation factor 3 subunit L n=1 Tax=Smittium megazygosporum TaxID=133381 RepID=A0A2T9ZCK8_9FUNG|nr:hypothetical protein BB560_003219 [Smittium megazygosporum]
MYQENYDDYGAEIDVDAVVDSFTVAEDFDLLAEEKYYEHQMLQQIQQKQLVAGIEAIPEQIRDFLLYFHRVFTQKNLGKLSHVYEYQFNKLSEKFFPNKSWPDPRFVSALVNDEGIFMILYREIYFRHIYARLQVTLEDRVFSFENYCELFNFILNSTAPESLELPNQWLWDIIDEFIYQYQTFCTFRSNVDNKSVEELEILKNNPNVWDTISVLNVLYSLISKSSISKQLYVETHGGDMIEAAGKYGSCQLYKMLGYFSLIGLLRVHCMLGDYTLALQSLENIDLGNHRALYTRVPACHVTIYYYVAFSYMMMRRYSDATRCLATILSFISRTRQYQVKSVHYDIINKKADQMYALLAICMALSPSRVDEQTHSTLREKYGEQQNKMQRGNNEEALAIFQDLFIYACPKFVNPTCPDFSSEKPSTSNEDGEVTEENDDEKEARKKNKFELQNYQLKIFMNEVSLQLIVPTLRSFLKLYTSMTLEKLASFLDVSTDELRNQLMVYKTRSSQLKHSTGASPLSGEPSPSTDLGFAIENDVVYIAESKTGRRYADWFIRNSTKILELVTSLETKA